MNRTCLYQELVSGNLQLRQENICISTPWSVHELTLVQHLAALLSISHSRSSSLQTVDLVTRAIFASSPSTGYSSSSLNHALSTSNIRESVPTHTESTFPFHLPPACLWLPRQVSTLPRTLLNSNLFYWHTRQKNLGFCSKVQLQTTIFNISPHSLPHFISFYWFSIKLHCISPFCILLSVWSQS